MGGNVSKEAVENDVLNQIMINVMTENSSNLSAESDQTNELNIVGSTGTRVTGLKQFSSSKVNVQALAQSTANNTLQADLISKLSTKVEQVNPLIAVGSSSDQAVKTSIKNAINSNITTKNMQNIAAQAKQNNKINITGATDTEVKDVMQMNEADLIIGLVQKTTAEIKTTIKAQTEVTTEATQKTAPLLDFGAGTIIFIVIIVIIAGFLYYVKSSGLAIAEIVAKPQVIALIIFVIGLSAFGVYEGTKKK